ncbi:hypothetical protein Ga0074812_108116 [Parafrankia irregularis]|uniref:Uncharacterized protein n=1 Tax=Parafrankia irregularis TaxID=795642 RepID=A0A0S4QP74_9ACTN|nr:hypothetical protein Ga0074812_108116 [Parafrankia irregularis]
MGKDPGTGVVGATRTPVEKAERTVAGSSSGNGAGTPVASLRGHDEKNLHGREYRSWDPEPVCVAVPGAVAA